MNVIYFLALMVSAFTVVVLAAYHGKASLQCAAVGLAVMTTVIAGKIVPLWGISASAGTATFTAIFLCTDLIAECYGKREALRTVGYTFIANLAFLLIGLLTVRLTEAEATATGTALRALFSWLPRLLAGGLIAFLVSQSCDVLLFLGIKKLTQGRHLWLRTAGSSAISQAIDTIIVWHIAFYGIIHHLWSVIAVAYVTKLLATLLETPFCYVGRALTPEYRNARSSAPESLQIAQPRG